MDKLIALPVKGDAFLLFRDGLVILVDGGYSSKNLANAIHKLVPSLFHIDVVVCTHSDRDHAGGLLSITEHFCGSIGEFWLPGVWASLIGELLSHPRDVFSGVVAEAPGILEALGTVAAKGESNLTDRLEALALAERRGELESYVYPMNSRPEDDHLLPGDAGWFSDMPLSPIEEALGLGPSGLSESGRNGVWDHEYCSRRWVKEARTAIYRQRANRNLNAEAAAYWLNLVNSANTIRAIAVQAAAYGIGVRFFDFEAFRTTRRAQGGYFGYLQPLNAVESIPPSTRLTYFARLSPANEECLAFIAPPSDSNYGVIFCGDSPLGDGAGYADSFLSYLPDAHVTHVITAPHHGAESNRIAYRHILDKLDNVLWLRSGGTVKQPGPTFQSMDPCVRACTHCPKLGVSLQEVVIPLSRSASFARVYSRECNCC